jgi:hypothetical protein
MSSYEIKKRQNELIMLKIQYAARCYFNLAERQNTIVWVFCLISAFSVFLPNTLPYYLSYAIPFVADIVAWFLMSLVNKNVEKGADLRKYFDAYSLCIDANQFSEEKTRQLLENAEKQYSKKNKEAEIQIRNTGSDNPPGVYDWYSFSKDYDGLEAQFECQRQNIWWDKKLTSIRYAVSIITCVIIVLVFIVLLVQNNVIQTLLCSAGLIIKLIERIIEYDKYRRQSFKIDGARENLSTHLTDEGIAQLQDMLNMRRYINILGVNFSHKKQASLLTEKYSKISNPK